MNEQQQPAPSVPDGVVIDLKHTAYDALTAAAMRSKWIPPEYVSNDWLADCINFLENGHPVPADLVRDAERYRWLRNRRYFGPAHGEDEPYLYETAIDAAIERDKLKGGA